MENSYVNPKQRNVKQKGEERLGWGLHDWFPTIPNITSINLGKGELNEFWWSNFIEKTDREITFTTFDRNDAINKYVMHMLKRLDYLYSIGDYERYWAIAWRLMEHSSSFFSLALRHVSPTWYKVWSLRRLNTVIRLYRLRIKDLKFSMTRGYIPKGDGSFRPLGIPGLVDRLVQSLYTKFFWWTVKERIPEEQHAYQPGKGVLTAWLHVLKVIIYQPNIWGFDLKKAFDRILRSLVDREILMSRALGPATFIEEAEVMGLCRNSEYANPLTSNIYREIDPDKLPPSLAKNARFFQSLFRQRINFPKKIESVEAELRKVGIGGTTYSNKETSAPVVSSSHYEPSIASPNPEEGRPVPEWMANTDWEGISEEQMDFLQEIAEQRELKRKEWENELKGRGLTPVWEILKGVPQGGNLSPLLFILSLREFCLFVKQQWESVFYADDGIICLPDEKFTVSTFEEDGLNFNLQKCEWIKKDNVWLKPLKFLGLKYDPWADKLIAVAKSGAEYVFDKEDLLKALVMSRKSLLYKFKELIKQSPNYTPHQERWLILQASQAFGFVYSRIVANSWLPEFVSRKKDGTPTVVSLIYEPNSWMGKVGYKIEGIDLYNASTYAHHSLLKFLGKNKDNKISNWKLKFAEGLWRENRDIWSKPHPKDWPLPAKLLKEFERKSKANETIYEDSELGQYLISIHLERLVKVKVDLKDVVLEKITTPVIRHIKVGKLERNREFNPNEMYARGKLGTLMNVKHLTYEELVNQNLVRLMVKKVTYLEWWDNPYILTQINSGPPKSKFGIKRK